MAADSIDFEYTPDERQAILEVIPSVEGEDKDNVIHELEKSARFAIMFARRPPKPYRKATLKKLQRLQREYENQHPDVKAELDHQIGRPFPSVIDDAIIQLYEVDCLPETGRQKNDAAITFVFHCRRIWFEHTGNEPSTRYSANKASRFYRFAKAAIPPEVHPPTSKGGNELTGVVRFALQRSHEMRQWRNVEETPA